MPRKERIWPDVVEAMVRKNPPDSFTAATLVEELDLQSHTASQVLARLRRWGYVKLVGFEDSDSGLGRRRHVYEVTSKARSYVRYMDKKDGKEN